MTTLTAVQAEQPPMGFRERAMRALETHQGMDLIAFLSAMHEAELGEVAEQAAAARGAVMQVTQSAAVDQQMLASVLSTVVPMLRTSAENSARAAHFSSMVEVVRARLNEAEAEGTMLDPEAVRRALDIAPALAPFRPTVLGFVPSNQFTLGKFRHHHTNVEWHLPFVGYQLCEEGPERPMTAHVAFLHKGVVRPRPQLYTDQGLVLEFLE